MLNLAMLLESSARANRDNWPSFSMTRSCPMLGLQRRSQPTGQWLAQAGREAGRQGRPLLPKPAVFSHCLLRHFETRHGGRAFQRAVQGARGGLSSQGQRCRGRDCVPGNAGTADEPDGLRRFQGRAKLQTHDRGHGRCGAAPPVEGEGVTTLGRTMAGQSPVFDTVQTMPDETAVILYTSGTTGSPRRGVTQANMVMNAVVTRDMVGFNKNDVALAVLPFFTPLARR